MKILSSILTSLLALPALAGVPGEPPERVGFERLNDAPGGSFYSSANAVSANGRVVVGTATTGDGSVAFRWTQEAGLVLLGDLPGGPTTSYATAVSADGSVIVGAGTTGTIAFPTLQAFRWTEKSGLVALGDRPGGTFRCWASGVSADGAIVVGVGSGSAGAEAVRWNAGSTIPVGLGDLSGGAFSSTAKGISADGSRIVGTVTNADGMQGGYWTAPNNITPLGDLPGGGFSSEANAISGNGQVIVGSSIVGAGLVYEAYRWTAEEGLVGLGDLPGGVYASKALAVSHDGKYIVGYGSTNRGEEAFIWTQETGMILLQPLLEGYGLPLAGWQISAALGISADGRVIVGRGTNPLGNTEAWIAHLPFHLCPGDATGDFTTGLNDVGALLQIWDTDIDPADPRDLDADGHIGLSDLNVVIGNWGRSCLSD